MSFSHWTGSSTECARHAGRKWFKKLVRRPLSPLNPCINIVILLKIDVLDLITTYVGGGVPDLSLTSLRPRGTRPYR